MPTIPREVFGQVCLRWTALVSAEAMKLFDEGVAPESCIPIAITIADAKDVEEARRKQELLVGVRPPHGLKARS